MQVCPRLSAATSSERPHKASTVSDEGLGFVMVIVMVMVMSCVVVMMIRWCCQ